jgi:hypothetical protein
MKNKDWTGNENSIFKTLGSSHHSLEDREENDYYATDPKAVNMLLELENFSKNILEPACGQGHVSKLLEERGHTVISTDLIYRGYGVGEVDFLNNETESGYPNKFNGDIITNPPYKFAKEFIEQSLRITPEGSKIAMFLKLTFLEGKGRKQFFIDNPPKTIYVSSSRINCAKNGDFEGLRTSGGSAVCYAWYIWENGFKGETVLKWFN